MSTRKRVRELVSRIFDIDERDLAQDSGLNRDPAWDSLSHVAIIALLEEELSIEFDDAEVVEAVNLKQLISLVEAKVGGTAR